MQLTKKLSSFILESFPQYSFVKGDYFKWSPKKNTIYYATLNSPQAVYTLLHELAHAELHHESYKLDIDLIQLETAAWEYARSRLAPRFKIVVAQNVIEDSLDTYRDWLYQRSLCPSCGQSGLQTNTNAYSCINCRRLWQTNDARMCGLRRVEL